MKTERQTSPRVYGRRQGRPLRVRKSHLMQELLPQLLITLKPGKHTSPQELFGNAWPASAEIGFGGGEHLAARARLHPETNFIGCEPFVNGVASLLDHVEREGIGNIRIFNDDARLLLEALPPASLDQCFILFPDPWPKKRHAERRFVGPENLARLARVLKPGAVLRLASDHVSLVEWMRACLDAHADFACAYAGAAPPPDWIATRYQDKAARAGRPAFFMDYKRL